MRLCVCIVLLFAHVCVCVCTLTTYTQFVLSRLRETKDNAVSLTHIQVD